MKCVTSRELLSDGASSQSSSITSSSMLMDDLGMKIAERAKSYVGTPYYHCGRDKNGLDCAGLVIRVMHDLGESTWDEIDYSTQVNATRLMHNIERFFDAVHQGNLLKSRWSPSPGDLILLSVFSNPQHVAWYVGSGMIVHAYDKKGIGRVVMHSFDSTWRRMCVAVYRWSGDKERD